MNQTRGALIDRYHVLEVSLILKRIEIAHYRDQIVKHDDCEPYWKALHKALKFHSLVAVRMLRVEEKLKSMGLS